MANTRCRAETTMSSENEEERRKALQKLDALCEMALLRHAWSMLVHHEPHKRAGRAGFFRKFTPFRHSIRPAKNRNPDKDASKPLAEDVDEESGINPFVSCEEESNGMQDNVGDEQMHSGQIEESTPTNLESADKSEAVVNGPRRNSRFGGSISQKIRQVSDARIQKKANKKVDKALARAEAEKIKWMHQAVKEEQEGQAALRLRREQFLRKGAARSKDLMLQHLCAIAVQRAWRSRSTRKQKEALPAALQYNDDTDGLSKGMERKTEQLQGVIQGVKVSNSGSTGLSLDETTLPGATSP